MPGKKYVLCIDDDKDDCSLLAESLRKANSFLVQHFENSAESALQFLKDAVKNDHLPEIIVLDINLPGMDGLKLLSEIKKILPRYVPVVFFSTNVDDDTVLFAESNGASVIKKPTSVKGYDEIAHTILSSML